MLLLLVVSHTVDTIDEMTSKAFEGLPRSQALETMIRFNEMKSVGRSTSIHVFSVSLILFIFQFGDRSKLKTYLENFRGPDKVVREEDIRLFVEGMREHAQHRE